MTRLAIRTISTAVITACTALSSLAAWAADASAAAPAPAPAPTNQTAPAAAPVVPGKGPLLKNAIELEIKIIHAQRRGQFIDQRVRNIEKLLKPLFNFSSYRLVREEKQTLAFDTEAKIKLAIGVTARITQRGTRDRKISLGVRIGRKQSVKLLLEDGFPVKIGMFDRTADESAFELVF